MITILTFFFHGFSIVLNFLTRLPISYDPQSHFFFITKSFHIFSYCYDRIYMGEYGTFDYCGTGDAMIDDLKNEFPKEHRAIEK